MFLLYKGFFFDIMDDPELMKNKENGNKRPCYYCFKSEKYDDIIWFVPVSTKVEKYQKIYNKKTDVLFPIIILVVNLILVYFLIIINYKIAV